MHKDVDNKDIYEFATFAEPRNQKRMLSISVPGYRCNKTGFVIGWDQYRFDQFETTDKFERTITFYVLQDQQNISLSETYTVPLIAYVNGSGGGSNFAPRGEKFLGSHIYENFLKPSARRARLMLIEKPGVKLHEEPLQWGTAEGCSQEFLRENTLDRWTEAVSAAISAAQTLSGIDSQKTLVTGHSEGGYVACSVAAANPTITHVASIATGGPTQLFDLVYFAVNNSTCIDFDTTIAISENEKVELIYSKWKEIQDDPTSIDKFFGKHPFNRWSSYCASSPLEKLLQSSAEAYLVHGTVDTATPILSFDLMLAELTIRGRSFVSERIDGADHSLKIATTGETRNELPNVVARVVNWFFCS